MKNRILVLSAVMLMMLASLAAAVDISNSAEGASVTVNETGRLSEASAQSALAQAGNVTRLNLSSSRSTAKWAGFMGTTSASVRIGIVSDILYNFGSAAGAQIKSVFAAQDSAFDFSNLNAATAAQVDSAFGFTTTDTDSATDTYTGTQAISGVSAPSTGLNAYTPAGALSTALYNTTLLRDGNSAAEGDFAFGVPVVPDQKDFRNSTEVDFELLAPVSNPNSPETYFFFLDVE